MQIPLFGNLNLDAGLGINANQIVNISSVPLRSPFRYAGGKTWLVPLVRRWLNHKGGSDTDLVEPFAGGGIISLTAAFESLVRSVTMVELDEDVAAVWKIILSDDAYWLADQIVSMELTPQSATDAINRSGLSLRDRAFATIVKNRVNRGGILATGAGFVKLGEGGKGILSRWYPDTLKKRILEIHRICGKVTFIHGDAFETCSRFAAQSDKIFFIDPPYTVAGRRLYTHSQVDHPALFELVDTFRGDFLMTYDDTNDIRNLASSHHFAVRSVPMKSTHHATKHELLISRTFEWLDT